LNCCFKVVFFFQKVFSHEQCYGPWRTLLWSCDYCYKVFKFPSSMFVLKSISNRFLIATRIS
jgi:hypothetical protein